MSKVSFTIPGKAVAKQRPRFDRRSGRAYTPKETVNYESLVSMAGAQAMRNRQVFTGPVAVAILVKMEMPTKPAWWIAAAASALIRPTVMPDADNVAKAVTDALNGICYLDDKQIVALSVHKFYADTPSCTVSIAPIDALGSDAKKKELETLDVNSDT